jgi:hypothetical protein
MPPTLPLRPSDPEEPEEPQTLPLLPSPSGPEDEPYESSGDSKESSFRAAFRKVASVCSIEWDTVQHLERSGSVSEVEYGMTLSVDDTNMMDSDVSCFSFFEATDDWELDIE